MRRKTKTQPQSNERFREKLSQQLRFLRRSATMYDEGHEDEAVRLATSLRVLFHDTNKSVSLLKHLGLKGQNVLSSSRGLHDWKDYLQIAIALNSPRPVTMRPMLGTTFRPISIADWWDSESVFVLGTQRFTRRVVILTATNKDGGAHVDSKVDAYYEALMAGKFGIGIEGNLQFNGEVPFPQGVVMYADNAHFALIRQFAHEAIASIQHFEWLNHA